jgi:hypothetical protein
MMQLKLLGEQEDIKPQRSTSKEIIKTMAEINEVENKRTIQRQMKQSGFFGIKNKVGKPLNKLTKRKEDTN